MTNGIVELIDNVLKNCDDIINYMLEDKVDMSYIMDFILVLENLSKEVDGLQNPEINIDELNEKLNYLLNALQQKDMDFFSDNLQYELKPLLEYWKEVI